MNKLSKKLDKNNLPYVEGILSIIANILLFGLKYWAGIVSGSIAIMADAWHTLSDSLSSVIVLLGTKFSKKPADKDHPFGHGRADLIAAFIIGIMLLLVSFDFMLKSYDALKNRESSMFGSLAIYVMITSVVLKELLAQFAFWAAKRSDSKVLKADAWHHRSDAISSLIILVGIFLGKYFWWLDGALGLIVALLIGQAAYNIIKDSIYTLLGESPSEEIVDKLKLTCKRCYPEDLYPHHFHVHSYGDHNEITFHICLPPEMTIREAHEIVDYIENQIAEEHSYSATLHIDPNDEKYTSIDS
ncbi:cation diffusion facilitator family transporter [Ancylomarina sp. 16SWW S1-10-2]|uniref:cation diffusion facilitator family transporter n=1 Tax=Ancylomarina sp. 16SWW S1-10-2 TaxID=2499681 RepID=UPI001E341FA7|nr:cation diffusion facilitator family transporter [Ancylomarina sp. 16SWW S1-10-2]